MLNAFDNDYVEELQKQAVNMAHHLQMVIEQTKFEGALSREIVLMNAGEALKKYFEMERQYDND